MCGSEPEPYEVFEMFEGFREHMLLEQAEKVREGDVIFFDMYGNTKLLSDFLGGSAADDVDGRKISSSIKGWNNAVFITMDPGVGVPRLGYADLTYIRLEYSADRPTYDWVCGYFDCKEIYIMEIRHGDQLLFGVTSNGLQNPIGRALVYAYNEKIFPKGPVLHLIRDARL